MGWNMPRNFPAAAYYALPFLVAFALSVVMLLTDSNLKTDFGSISSGYYSHWYVVLGTAIVDLLGAGVLLLLRSRAAFKGGVALSGLMIVLFLADILTYSQVGFTSATDFANYLFGISSSGTNIRYLYDALLAVYIVTFVGGLMTLAKIRRSAS